jgi:hypothetical protein
MCATKDKFFNFNKLVLKMLLDVSWKALSWRKGGDMLP